MEATAAIRQITQAELGSDYYLSGGPVIDEQFFVNSERDSRLTISLMLLLLVVMLLIAWQSSSPP